MLEALQPYEPTTLFDMNFIPAGLQVHKEMPGQGTLLLLLQPLNQNSGIRAHRHAWGGMDRGSADTDAGDASREELQVQVLTTQGLDV